MEWFKKIIRVFKEDSVEAEDLIEHKHPGLNSGTKNHDSSRDMNAKIAYQYPRESLTRFGNQPIVNQRVDRPKRKYALQPEPTELTERENEKDTARKQSPRLRHTRQEEIIPDIQTIALPEKEKPKKEKIRHGPFRPTEIPSPIYGYDRPRQTKVIEHELTGFIPELESNIMDEAAVTLEKEDILETKQLNPNEPDLAEDTNELNESNHPLSQALEEILLEEANSLTKEDRQNAEIVNVRYEPIQMEGYSTEPIQMEGHSTEPIDVQNTTSIEQTDEKESQEFIEKENVLEKQSERQPSRSHIPFNVLMLKQDREKLNQVFNRSIESKKPEEKESAKPVHTIELDPPHREIMQDEEAVNYLFPSDQLLMPPVIQEENGEWLEAQEELLNQTLANFNVGAKVVNVTQGPAVTRFEVQPDPGVKVNKITNLQDDIKLSLAAKDIRIEAPIPGKHTIGIEVPNHSSRPVLISEILTSPEFRNSRSPLTAALGLDISGKPVVTDLRKMPHGLIAGATGSGKSVCINSILTSLLYKANPNEVKLVLIDPKMVELAPYNHIPHLVSPVITDVKAATAALKWAVEEMERRYELFAHTGVREISRFNDLAESAKRYSEKLPYILIIIDELADLMMVSPADVEEAVCRIAQKARACGIHLIIATQRPSVDVITGLIKANVPTRIAFSVSSQIDSRTIIDISGAEKLLGRGDMLFLENGTSKPVRLQGTFISDTEIDKVVEHVRGQGEPEYLFEQSELIKKAQVNEEEDELFSEACEFIVDQGTASTSSLQRRFKIGYNRAARLIDLMEQNGFISEARGSKPRDVLITENELDSLNSSSKIN
ncbi:DNA translocase FtsK [Neobacillus sp. LXY-4]|uniref:DNA translocase FtsK n=1 Tax=Neobacillus sp. LXY-4 TaxID=3379826 RepID=UPI003EDFC62D